MVLYSADNSDTFPLVPNTGNGTYVNAPSATLSTNINPNDEIADSYNAKAVGAGDPARCLWLMVVRGQIVPGELICKSDPAIKGRALLTNTAGRLYQNATPTSLSYSIAYPWAGPAADAGPAPWWKNTTASDIPIMSDMAPMNNTGSGPDLRNVTLSKGASTTPKSFNSNNHGGTGQNVAFADSHVEFTKDPYVGQATGSGMSDNIFTTGPVDATHGGTPVTKGKAGPPGPTTQPFDIYMVPVRNVSDNSM